MSNIRWDNISDWDNSRDETGANHSNDPYTSSSPKTLKQGYEKQWPPMTHRLVGWWPLHTAKPVDLSGNNNHGTKNGGVTTGVAGKSGLEAMSFDGTDDYMDIGEPAELSASSLGDSFSVSVRIYWRNIASSSDNQIIARGGTGGNDNFQLKNRNGNWGFYLDTADKTSQVETSTSIEQRTWHTATFVYDSSSVSLFLNGNKIHSESWTGGLASASGNSWMIARRQGQSGESADAVITDARIYNRSLSTSEVQTLYEWGNADLASPPNDGVARYKLDGDATDTWGSNDGTNNGTTFVSDSISGQSGNFQPSNNEYIDLPEFSTFSSYTLSVWLKTDDISHSSLKSAVYIGTNQRFFIVDRRDGFYSSDGLTLVHDDGSGQNTIIDDSISEGVWSHYVMTWDGSTQKAYKNGTILGSNTTSSQRTGFSKGQHIGDWEDSTHYYWDGSIDDVRIYDYALNPQEVFELYRWGTKGINLNKHTVMQ